MNKTTNKPKVMTYWAFSYNGPIEAIDDRDCSMCNAAAKGKCAATTLEHGTNPEGCSRCYAAKVKRCNVHCGLERAINDIEYVTTNVHNSDDFGSARRMIREYVSTMPTTAFVEVHAHSFRDEEDGPLARLNISVNVKK